MGCGATSGKPAPAPLAHEGSIIVSVIIWGAKGLRNADTGSKSDPYCVARVGSKGSAWSEKLRGSGRRSEHWHGSTDPEWRMAFSIDVAKMSEPELQVRVYDADWVGADDFLGEAKVSLSDLHSKPSNLPLSGTSTTASSSISVSAGTVDILAHHNIKPSAFYEALAPFGKVKSVKVEDITGEGPLLVGTAPLPESMRGLFWLMDQENSSALASFAGPTKDGGGCSTGQLDNGRYIVRTAGDRVWAFADKTLTSTLVDAVDLTYHFIFNDPDKPTKVQIYPEVRELGFTLTAEWLLSFEGELVIGGSEQWPGSVVWQRPSYILGSPVGEYSLVQVMDSAGKRIEPAWSKFVEYQKSKVTGDTPGEIFYHAIE